MLHAERIMGRTETQPLPILAAGEIHELIPPAAKQQGPIFKYLTGN